MDKDTNKDKHKDMHAYEGTYRNWKEQVVKYGIDGISKKNSDLLKQFIFDLEIGQNISSKTKKGRRSHGRLVVLKNKLIQLIKILEKRGIKDITKTTQQQIHVITDELYKGEIKRVDGGIYECPADFIRSFKTFWHWWMKVNRKNGINNIYDIGEDLQLTVPENKFCYFTKEQMEQMLPLMTYYFKVFCLFLFDSLVRFPSEACNLRVRDVYVKEDGNVWVNISKEVATKTGIARTFNLLYCGEELLRYLQILREEFNRKIQQEEIRAKKDPSFKFVKRNFEDEFLFGFLKDYNYVARFNKNLKEIAVKVFGDVVSHPIAKEKFSKLSGYDFRHCGAIHFRNLAQKTGVSLDAIRQRGGWVDFKMINYYTKFLGLDGGITKEQLLIQEDKTRLEKDLMIEKEAREKLEIDVSNLKTELKKELMKQIMAELEDKETEKINSHFIVKKNVGDRI